MSKSALVISGGGSKGAFAGGVAQYLIEETKHHYDLFLGTSTGSLLVSHLALNKIEEIKIKDDKAVMNEKASEYNLNDSKLYKDIKTSIHNLLGINENSISVEILY